MKASVYFKNVSTHKLAAGIIVVIAFLFMIFIYAPLEMFFYNQDDFWFDIFDLLPVLFPLFFGSAAVAVLMISAVCIFMPRVYKIVLPACCIAFVCTYIQGNFMVNNLPPLDGTEVNWADYSSGRIQSVVLWVAVTVLVCILLKIVRLEKFCKIIKMDPAIVAPIPAVTAADIHFTNLISENMFNSFNSVSYLSTNFFNVLSSTHFPVVT